MKSCTKCAAPLPIQTGRGRRRTLCESCSPSPLRVIPCEVPGCQNMGRGMRGLCPAHYQRLRRWGTLDPYPDQVCRICGGPIADTGKKRTICGARDCYRAYMTERGRAYKAKGLQRERDRERRAADPTLGRARWLKFRYGLTLADYDRALAAQGGICALCATPAVEREFFVDHDHGCCPGNKGKTCGGCIRGLICARCNTGLGLFEDDPSLLRAAADYLAGRTTQKEIPA